MYDNNYSGVVKLKDKVLTKRTVLVNDRMALLDEIRQVKLDVEARKLMWSLAEPGYEDAAWHAYQAASERLNALLREAKQGVGA